MNERACLRAHVRRRGKWNRARRDSEARTRARQRERERQREVGARMNERCTTRMELMSGINIESSSAPERDGRALLLSLSLPFIHRRFSLPVFLCSFLSAPSVGPGPCTLASSPRRSLVQLVVHACAIVSRGRRSSVMNITGSILPMRR